MHSLPLTGVVTFISLTLLESGDGNCVCIVRTLLLRNGILPAGFRAKYTNLLY